LPLQLIQGALAIPREQDQDEDQCENVEAHHDLAGFLLLGRTRCLLHDILVRAWSFLALRGGARAQIRARGLLMHSLRTAYARLMRNLCAGLAMAVPHSSLHTSLHTTYAQRDIAYARVPIGLLTCELTRNLRTTKLCLRTQQNSQELQARTKGGHESLILQTLHTFSVHPSLAHR
jgi:hypothetical protein